MAFFVMNSEMAVGSEDETQMLDAAFSEANRFLDANTGSWGMGNVSHVQRINGAMKMLAAHDWAKRPIPYPDSLIDYTLSERSSEDGCGVLDKLFVLKSASEAAPGYRVSDLEKKCVRSLGRDRQLSSVGWRILVFPKSCTKAILWSLSEFRRAAKRYAWCSDVYLGLRPCTGLAWHARGTGMAAQ